MPTESLFIKRLCLWGGCFIYNPIYLRCNIFVTKYGILLFHVFTWSSMCSLDRPCVHLIVHVFTWSAMCSLDLPCVNLIFHVFTWSSMCSLDHPCVHLIFHVFTWSSMCPLDRPCVHLICHVFTWSSMCSFDLPCVHLIFHVFTWSYYNVIKSITVFITLINLWLIFLNLYKSKRLTNSINCNTPCTIVTIDLIQNSF